jgi:hypothetical protein
MPIPPLDAHGLLPEGLWDCHLDDIFDRYTYTDSRMNLYEKFVDFIRWYRALGLPDTIYMDGSFTSDKTAPGDIDVVVELADQPPEVVFKALDIFSHRRERLFEEYQVDFWLRHPILPNDLLAFFTYVDPEDAVDRNTPPNHRKGLLRVSFAGLGLPEQS